MKPKTTKSKLLDKLAVDAVDIFVKELKKEENYLVIEATIIDPLIEHVITKVKPFVILMTALFMIIIILMTFMLYITLK